MRARPAQRALRALETWLWTGPLGHLVGGALDVGEALVRHAWRTRIASRRAARAARRSR